RAQPPEAPTLETAERRRMEQELAQRDRLYRTAIEAAGAVPYARNYVLNRFDYVGPGIEPLLGYPPEALTVEVWNASVLEVQPFGKPTALSPAEISRQLREQQGPGWWADVRVRTAAGEERWVMNAAVKVTDEAENVTGSLGLWQDVTFSA